MKFKYLLIAVLAGAALVGCNKEAGKDVTGTEQDGEKRYMGFTITTPPATKAENTDPIGNFQKAEDFENAVHTIHFFFYKDGAYVSWGYGEVATDFNPEKTGDTEKNIENFLHDGSGKGVVVMESTMTMPNQVLCVINSRNPDFYRNKPLADVQASLQTGSAESLIGHAVDAVRNPSTSPEIDFWYEATVEGVKKPYFVMLTAPMKGVDKNGKDEIKYVTDIPEGAIKETREAAKANPVEVYVERMAARLEITNLASIVDADGFVVAANLGNDMLNAGVPEYDIKPIAWSVTVVNQKGNVLKKADLTWWNGTADEKAPFAGGWLESGTRVTNVLYTGSDPSKQTMYTRINWTIDPNYNEPAVTNRNRYPHSARELFDTSAPNELRYYSANEIANNYDSGAADNADAKDVRQRYALENTFGKLGQNDPRIPGTMILLTAQAKKHGPATDPFVDLYAYLGQIYNFAEYADHVVSTLDANGFTFYLKDDMTEKVSDFDFEDDTKPNYKDPTTLFEVKKATKYINMFSNNEASFQDLTSTPSSVDPTKKMPDLYNNWVIELERAIQPSAYDTGFPTIPAFAADEASGYADGYVTLVPKSGVTLYLEDPAHVTDPTVTPACKVATPAQIAQAFLGSVIEPANRYEEGLMYYAIPIEHFGKAKDGATPPQLLDGNYGVVRNNLYKVEINKINTLGHGIDDPDEPIVPGDRKKPLYIAAKINILSWQIVSQRADLAE